jgi:hypothetical protein
MTESKDELSILFPFNDIELGGEKINLRPFPFGKWPEVILKAAGTVNIVLGFLQAHGESALDVSFDEGNFRVSPQAFELLLRLIRDGGDNLYDILAISARKPRAWVDGLEGEDGLQLLVGTYLVNKDFFVKQVAPLFPRGLLETMKSENLGQKPSPGAQLPKR